MERLSTGSGFDHVGLNFRSHRLLSAFGTWARENPIPVLLRPTAAEIFAFDVLIQNADRRQLCTDQERQEAGSAPLYFNRCDRGREPLRGESPISGRDFTDPFRR